ncbi:MAG: PIN domain-containing protein [Spirochaetaceae bacterium]|nr:PIN domain-containing protein [Spirochaetaceae bacterium]
MGYPEITDREKNDILDFLSKLPVIPITESIENKTIEIRCKTKLELPDSIIAATAIVLGATLITHDNDLLKANFPGLIAQSFI